MVTMTGAAKALSLDTRKSPTLQKHTSYTNYFKFCINLISPDNKIKWSIYPIFKAKIHSQMSKLSSARSGENGEGGQIKDLSTYFQFENFSDKNNFLWVLSILIWFWYFPTFLTLKKCLTIKISHVKFDLFLHRSTGDA